jgi:hypothetical protein
LRLVALLPDTDLELDLMALLEALGPRSGDVRVVHEDVLAAFA